MIFVVGVMGLLGLVFGMFNFVFLLFIVGFVGVVWYLSCVKENCFVEEQIEVVLLLELEVLEVSWDDV